MKALNKNNCQEYEINVTKSSGKQKIVCPACVESRSNKSDKALSWDIAQQVGKCHYCEAVFYVKKEQAQMKKEYKRPQENNTDLTAHAVKWFEGRGISQFTLRQMKVSSGTDWMPKAQKEVETIRFNYYRDSELVNIKYRGPNKDFKLHPNAELVFYNLDEIKGLKEIIIVEGEIDCLSVFECGHHNVVSVPNGAGNFDFIENCFDLLEGLDSAIIAVDDDLKGRELQEKLILSIGAEKCKLVDFKGEKDANEYLMRFGAEDLKKVIDEAKDIPIDGVVYVDDVWSNMLHQFRNGQKVGTTTHYRNLDEHWAWRESEVNIWTGYANEGKSAFFNQLMIIKAKHDGWKFAIFTPENYPVTDLYNELIHCYVGKTTDKRYSTVMSEQEYEQAARFIHEHFFAIVPDDNYELKNVLGKMKYLIRKYGVKGCLIDPYNQIDHQMKSGEREDLYISRFMSKLKKFAVDNDISFNLVAHQNTPNIDGRTDYPRPDTYRIKGGGTFTDKADNVIVVWRPYRKSDYTNTTVTICVEKVKKQKLVGIPGQLDLQYDFAKNQYYDEQEPVYSKLSKPKQELVNYYETEPNEEFDFSPINEKAPF